MVLDIHYQSYLKELYGEATKGYQLQSLQMLQSIQGMLYEHFYLQQAPYNPVPPQYTQTPQSAPQQETEFQPLAQHSEMKSQRLQIESIEDSEYDYKAQYRKPTQK